MPHLPSAPLLLAESVVHSMDPFVIRFSDSFGVRWYGVAYLAGFVVAWIIVHRMARRGVIPMRPALVGDFMTACVIGVVAGGRLGHVVFYDPHLLWTVHGTFPFWGLLELHKGGMSSHGGIIGTFLAMAWFARRHAIPLLALCDTVCFTAIWGLMFGRLANWVNGELWGKVLPDSMQANPPWWSVKFPEEAIDRATPETLAQVKHLYAMTYAGSADAAAQIAQLVPARYPSQFIQAFTDGPILLLVFTLIWLKPRPAGTIFAAFFISYGALRLLSEQFRDPDAGVFTLGPLTLPMLFSIGMMLVGAGLSVLARRQPKAPADLVGGLFQPSRA